MTSTHPRPQTRTEALTTGGAAPDPHVQSRAPKPRFYVLSAGRTGTVFLETLIRRHFPDVTAEHEPSPSRYLMMLGNLRNDWGMFGGLTRSFARKHQNAHHDGPGKYIEINPFLCPVSDLLETPERPLRIVHMVRAPGDWAQSMTTFKASTRYRHIIDYVPFAKPFPTPRPTGWSGLSPFEKSLHRWNWCNNRIAALACVAQSYTLVRSEDVFGTDVALRDSAVQRIFETLQLDLPEALNADEFQTRVNPAPAGADLRDAQAERAICGATAAGFGYDL